MSATLEFLRGRETVLGHRTWLHDDPSIAADQLVDRLGPDAARAWLRALAEEVAR